MNKLLIPAAAFAATCLVAAAAQAGEVIKFEYLKQDKCVLQKVELVDPPLRELCFKKLTQQISDDCTGSGGTFNKGALSCDIPASKAPGFRKLIDKHFGGPGPYNPNGRGVIAGPGPAGTGCVLRPGQPAGGCARPGSAK